ncbi:MAG: glycosyltransferase [Vicingaceae bacterium]
MKVEKKQALISVVIPTYNQTNFIDETLRSVISQSYKNLQIIVADDCSTDGTVDKLKQYVAQDQRIELLLSEVNLGIPTNFNRAFDACTGEFVAFLGGDDIMLPEKLETQVRFLKENKEYVLVQSDMELFDSQSGKTVKLLSDNGVIPTKPLDWALKVDWNFENKYSGVLPSSCLARADYYLAARYSDALYLKHELLFTIECYCRNPKGKWGVIPKVLGRYRLHETNFSQTKNANQSILMESFKLAEMARTKCNHIRERVNEFEFFTAYKAILFSQAKTKNESTVCLQIFNSYANKQQKIGLKVGRILNKLGLLGLYLQLNRRFKYFSSEQ